MTLNTSVAMSFDPARVQRPDLRTAYNWALTALCVAGQVPGRISTATDYGVERPKYGGEHIMSTVGQGLPGIVMARQGRGGAPYAATERWDSFDDDEGSKPWYAGPACDIELSWDTGYAYRSTPGGCSGLHARAIALLRYQTLAKVGGIELHWHNEFDGTWHDLSDPQWQLPLDRFAGEVVSDLAWYRALLAQPAIQEQSRSVRVSAPSRGALIRLVRDLDSQGLLP